MSWVRIHDDAMNSLKVMRLSDSAFRLWMKGLCYCQRQLTDGAIPIEWLKDIGAKRKDVEMLSASMVDGKAPLWEPTTGGYRVHDYLDWNDSRAVVTKKRSDAKERMAAARAPKKFAGTDERTCDRSSQELLRGSVLSSSDPKTNEKKPIGDWARDPFTDPVITERAGRFVDRYLELYAKHRHGARYPVNPNRDYSEAVTLCRTYPDERLDKLAVIFLTTDHEFAEKGSRTVGQFRSMAGWCDGKLAEHESKKKGAA